MNLKQWYNETPISAMLQLERLRCEYLLTNRCGQTIAFMANDLPFFAEIPHSFKKAVLVTEQPVRWHPQVVAAHYDELPFCQEYLDCIVLLHIFDFSQHIDQTIAELWRVTAAEGIVMLFGFNTMTLFPQPKLVKQLALANQQKHLNSPSLLRSKMMQQGFELVEFTTLVHQPIFKNEHLMQRCKFLNIVGEFLWPNLGAIYYGCFKKVVVPLTPQPSSVLQKFKKIAWHELAEPTT